VSPVGSSATAPPLAGVADVFDAIGSFFSSKASFKKSAHAIRQEN
jgi:hypothetical protein